MAETTFWETINAQGNELFAKLKQLVHEGNVRRVAVRQGGRTVAEFPLTAGVVGAVFAPALAAIGAIIAIANDCTIEVERTVVDTEPVDRRSDDRASGSTSM
jgi:Domain of unknown function (DUF4342)